MAGRTGYDEFDNGLPPEGPEQMNAIFEHFDPLIDATVATASSIPSTGNWVGRRVFVQDVQQVRMVTALPNTWKTILTLVPVTFTPSLSNILIGSGATSEGDYSIVGNQVFGQVRIVLGSGAALNSSQVEMAAPVTPANPIDGNPIGRITVADAGVGYHEAVALQGSGGSFRFFFNAGAGSAFSVMSASSWPGSFSATDVIQIRFQYRI